jgi:hypothetical protein
MVFFGFLHCVVVKCSDTLNRCAASMFRVTELVWMVDAVMLRKMSVIYNYTVLSITAMEGRKRG